MLTLSASIVHFSAGGSLEARSLISLTLELIIIVLKSNATATAVLGLGVECIILLIFYNTDIFYNKNYDYDLYVSLRHCV